MKVYLAARYARRDELKVVAAELRRMGHEPTSQWLATNYDDKPEQSIECPLDQSGESAVLDLRNVADADVVINFTEAPGIPFVGRGGRHVELGYALGLGKRVIVIGHRENLFHYHPSVEFVSSTQEMLCWFETVEGGK